MRRQAFCAFEKAPLVRLMKEMKAKRNAFCNYQPIQLVYGSLYGRFIFLSMLRFYFPARAALFLSGLYTGKSKQSPAFLSLTMGKTRQEAAE
jgi:hypothetical protein